VCRSWEGAQPGSKPKQANGNIPYHGHHAQFMNGGWPEGRNPAFSFPLIQILSCPGIQTFPGVQSFFRIFCEICKYLWVWGSMITAWGLAANQSSCSEKIVPYIVCFVYSLLALLLSLLVLLVVLVFSLCCLITISLSQPMTFVHCYPRPCWGGRGGVSEQLVGPDCCLLG